MFPSLLLVAPSVFASSLPVKCPAVFAPVCGDDGVTYSNECELNAKNVKKQFDGKCRCKCTGVTPLGCPVPKTCPKGFEYGECRQLCNQATCKLELLAPGCVRIISPPEPSKCTATTAKALCEIAKKPLLSPEGCIKCAPGVVQCDTLKCDESTNCNIKVVPPTCERPKECNAITAKALCEIAKKPLLHLDCIKCAPGVVQCNSIKCDVSTNCNNIVVPPPPCKCSAVFAPVCGDDGVTYSNECELNAKNVKKQFDGKCKCKCTGVTPLGCPVPKTCPKGFEYGGCRQLCNQATCKLELLAPGCVRIISPPKPRK